MQVLLLSATEVRNHKTDFPCSWLAQYAELKALLQLAVRFAFARGRDITLRRHIACENHP